MKTLLLMVFLVFMTLLGSAQENSRRKKPFFVSHLSTENKKLLYRKEAGRHTIFSKLICFKKKCRGYIGWRKRQRRHRFKGYKDGGKTPKPRITEPGLKDDTLMAQRPPHTIMKQSHSVLIYHEQLVILDEVLFEVNSARLNHHFTFRLDSLADLLRKHNKLKAKITGHTDNSGSESLNLKLSKDRAEAVANYLINKGIQIVRITYEGKGSKQPIASNATMQERRKNRRVEIILSE
ncbi:MAG TPA: OmpA family protein [Ohtaekwangia sp.]|nr:OmpA family protein [Ohtaekwangia sp.]